MYSKSFISSPFQILFESPPSPIPFLQTKQASNQAINRPSWHPGGSRPRTEPIHTDLPSSTPPSTIYNLLNPTRTNLSVRDACSLRR
ncbi:hypothetical protein BofuT4_uP010910.1 [Botrytis cinerea T4]|uniref:Uncharacterized protein n=1 Tax=Botryotinia fuckeliana (strain T4) TaxID=999810 RepID=G2XTC9_BOTF4|nr:hypothetical protein BofuT4_uP010910.1 [Botrytis cinerea T4]